MTATVTVRQAGPDDVAALISLRRAWTAEQHGTDDPDFDAQFTAWYAAESGHRVFWLAELDGTAIGMVNLVIFTRMPKPGFPAGRWGYLSNAFVLPAHRDAGAGAAMMDALLAYARAEKLVRVLLSPSQRSVPFYRRAGFYPAESLLVTSLDDDYVP
ncbi:GNAT family N-acetyltransferase [Catellatospora tritici]|uniref:GNAT family N-acetyltransferase n=1 Tax=Catellatospora tritici TaxID=2851566 RepID=UPI001C2D30FA|nr:GNAT family N-acetyltransferase [Catellatospora tritici]MBV1851486.1 GNAT family N-acetyltransferase [Catellatospora tritici]